MALWSMGANQSTVGTLKNRALINLCLATGQIGRPGCGPLSLTGQPNAMGGRETGGLAHLLPGYRKVADAGDRAAMAAHWGVDVERDLRDAGAARRRAVRRARAGAREGRLDHGDEPARVAARQRARPRRARARRARRRAGPAPPDRDLVARPRRAAGRRVAGEGGHDDELRAAHRARAPRRRAARRGAAGLADRRRPRAPSRLRRRASPGPTPPPSSTSSPPARPAGRAT